MVSWQTSFAPSLSKLIFNVYYEFTAFTITITQPTSHRFTCLYVCVLHPYLSSFVFLFQSIDKISKVTSPVLVIHGTEDEVIDFSHGLALYERCQRPVEPLWVEGAGHNDVELYGQYLERLKQFVAHELVNL